MNAAAAVRRVRIRRILRRIGRSESRQRALKAEARCEAMFAETMRAHLSELEADARSRGWLRAEPLR
jgi:hypothetical protein